MSRLKSARPKTDMPNTLVGASRRIGSPLNTSLSNTSLKLTTTLTVGVLAASGLALAAPTSAAAVSSVSPSIVRPASAAPLFRSADARYGVQNSSSVKRLQKLLIRKGYATAALRAAGPTGNYLTATKASVRKFQRAIGFRGAAANGILGKKSAKKLGLRWSTAAPITRPVTSVPSTPVSTSPGQALSATQLKSVLQKAGFREPSIRTAWAVVMRESRAYPAIVSPKNSNGTRDHGLFQINDVHRAYADFSRIYDPVYNAQYAFQLSNGGTEFSHWGIGDKGWAGTLKKQSPTYWQQLQDNMLMWRAQYPG